MLSENGEHGSKKEQNLNEWIKKDEEVNKKTRHEGKKREVKASG